MPAFFPIILWCQEEYLRIMSEQHEEVILVDEHDRALGVMEKLEAHQKGMLHRAFSVFIFNSKGEMLLQQRASGKYHSGSLFTNACCSHPRPGESVRAAAERRLGEEMGIQTELKERCTFIYRSEFENGLTEHELDHVLEGVSNDTPQPDPAEVKSWQWLPIEEIRKQIMSEPQKFTTWFRIAMEKIY